jgi:predicted ATPase/DNA-binding CsgD family transcriptional regulator
VSWRVPSLGLPPPPVRVIVDASQMQGEVEGLQGYEAVRLFVDRAAAALPSFVLTEKNGPAVAQICRRLDGIPLAIELAAARVKALAPEHIAERLGQRFRLLTGGSRTALPRHQTLRALVDWSYGLLTTSEQSLFHRLAVFVGGFDLEAAEEVCAGGAIETAAVMDLLLRLVDKSLVVVESGESGAQRFRLLETLRQYGMERLVTTGEADAAHGRHAAYFMRVGEETDPLLRGPRPRVAFDRVEVEQDNMRTALRWLAEDGTPDQAMRLAAMLGWFWYVRGYNSEGRGWLAEALARPSELPPSSMRSRVCWLAALLAYRQGDLDAARTLNEESLAIGRAAADAVRIAEARLLSGVLHRDQGEYRAARSAFEESLSTAQGAGDGFSTALGHYWLGIVALDEGDCTTARARLEEGLAVRRRIEDRWACCTSLERLAEVALQQRDYPAARDYADESLAIAREIGYPQGVARSLRCLGTLALVRGEATAAREKYAEALTIWRSMGDRAAIAQLLEESATTAAAQGAPGRALRLAGAAAGLRGALGMRLSPTGRDRTARALAPARRALGSDAAAAWTAGEALTLEQAIEMVLADEAPEGPYAPGGVGPLTARECGVAVLIGRGMGNREIADELVVSVRTVESHVASIRAKLDLDSRAKIAVWALERGLLG